MITIDQIKKSMRITTSMLDDDIQRLINTAEADLAGAGVTPPQAGDENPVYDYAIDMFVKSAMDYRGDAKFYELRYALTRNTLQKRKGSGWNV